MNMNKRNEFNNKLKSFMKLVIRVEKQKHLINRHHLDNSFAVIQKVCNAATINEKDIDFSIQFLKKALKSIVKP